MDLLVQHTLGYGLRVDAANMLPAGLRMLVCGPDFHKNLTVKPAFLQMIIHIISQLSSMDIINLSYLKAIPAGGAETATERNQGFCMLLLF